MKKLAIVFRLFLKIISWLATLVFIYLFAAFVLSVLPTHPEKTNCKEEQKIYISSNGVHLDIVIPIELLSIQFLKEMEPLRNTRFVSFGWGDKNFYINTPEWSDLTFQTAFKALFLKSETAMHVTFYSTSFPHWKEIQICPEQAETIIRYIQNSFSEEPVSNWNILNVPGYTDHDFFYEAKGSFSLFFTCNIWVNRALKEAGIKTSVWSPFDKGILFQMNKNDN